MRKERHKCGCVSVLHAERWFELCPPHKAESDEVRGRWAQERAVANASEQSLPTSTRS